MKKTVYENIAEQVIEKKCDCGLKVCVIPKKGYKKTYAILATDFGSIDRNFILKGEEVTVPDGIAHFLEHKMFEQEDGSNAFDEFAKYGANANAFTSFEMTGYLFQAAENPEACLKHLLSYVYAPYFTDENVSKEQGIIGQEIKMYDDNPGWSAFFNLLRGMYRNHPINIDIAGTCEEIAKITKESLYTCYNSYYHPENMMLCVVGAVEAEKVFEIVDSAVTKTPYFKAETILPDECEEVAQQFIERKMSVANPIYAIGFKEKESEDVIESQALYNVLIECVFGKSSRLYNKLYENGTIFNMSASYNVSKKCAFAEITGEAENPRKVYDEILAEIEAVKNEGFSEDEVETAKKALYGKYIRKLNDVEEIATSFVANAFLGGDYFEYGEKLLAITAEKLDALMKQGFSHSALSQILPIGENK